MNSKLKIKYRKSRPKKKEVQPKSKKKKISSGENSDNKFETVETRQRNKRDTKKRKFETLASESSSSKKQSPTSTKSNEPSDSVDIEQHVDSQESDIDSLISVYGDIDPQKKELLELELKLDTLITDIKKSLGLEKAETDFCVEKLMEINSFANKITATILKKNSNCVTTIISLKKYVGNVSEWNLTENEKEVFLENAEKIRELASNVNNIFKEILNFSGEDDESFSMLFKEMVRKFEERSKNFNDSIIAELCYDEELDILEKAELDSANVLNYSTMIDENQEPEDLID